MVYISRMSVLCFGSQHGTLWILSNSLKMIHIDRNIQELRQIVFKKYNISVSALLVLLCELFVSINVKVNVNIMLMLILI